MNHSQPTMDLLLSISQHLSARSQCKDVNYIVRIGKDTISFCPDIKVFPSVHRRKFSDKESVLCHVLKYHFSHSLLENTDVTLTASREYSIDSSALIQGTYVYRSSIDGKRRKWFREH